MLLLLLLSLLRLLLLLRLQLLLLFPLLLCGSFYTLSWSVVPLRSTKWSLPNSVQLSPQKLALAGSYRKAKVRATLASCYCINVLVNQNHKVWRWGFSLRSMSCPQPLLYISANTTLQRNTPAQPSDSSRRPESINLRVRCQNTVTRRPFDFLHGLLLIGHEPVSKVSRLPPLPAFLFLTRGRKKNLEVSTRAWWEKKHKLWAHEKERKWPQITQSAVLSLARCFHDGCFNPRV